MKNLKGELILLDVCKAGGNNHCTTDNVFILMSVCRILIKGYLLTYYLPEELYSRLFCQTLKPFRTCTLLEGMGEAGVTLSNRARRFVLHNVAYVLSFEFFSRILIMAKTPYITILVDNKMLRLRYFGRQRRLIN